MEESQDKVTMHLEADLMKLTPHSFPLTFIFWTLEKRQIPNIKKKLKTINSNPGSTSTFPASGKSK